MVFYALGEAGSMHNGPAQQFEIDNKQQCCAAQQFEVDVGEQLLFGPSLVGCGLDLVIINAVLLGVVLIDVSLYLACDPPFFRILLVVVVCACLVASYC